MAMVCACGIAAYAKAERHFVFVDTLLQTPVD